MPHVYMLRCADGSYYVGSTWDLERRVWQHNGPTEGAAYTRSRQPVELVWSGEYESIAEAFSVEKRIQGWSRAKREALIRGDFHVLPGLSRNATQRRRARERRGFDDGR
ncbi:MAG: excinuclease subunit [Marmoricola sp.]|nr:excinuclease subunit [Marmoricola sp.]